MQKKAIHTTAAPAAVGPYPRAVQVTALPKGAGVEIECICTTAK